VAIGDGGKIGLSHVLQLGIFSIDYFLITAKQKGSIFTKIKSKNQK
jgi:hypothetical protein